MKKPNPNANPKTRFKRNHDEIRDEIREVIAAIEKADMNGWPKPWILNILKDIANGTRPDTAFEFTNEKGGTPPNDKSAEFAIYLQMLKRMAGGKSRERAAAEISVEYDRLRARRTPLTVSKRIRGLAQDNIEAIYDKVKEDTEAALRFAKFKPAPPPADSSPTKSR